MKTLKEMAALESRVLKCVIVSLVAEHGVGWTVVKRSRVQTTPVL